MKRNYLDNVVVFVRREAGSAHAVAHALQAKQVALALMRQKPMDWTGCKETSL